LLKNREAESSPDPREDFGCHSYSITALAQHSPRLPKKGGPPRKRCRCARGQGVEMSGSNSLNVAACLAALGEILLVVVLGAPEGLSRLDLGDDGFGCEAALGGELLDLGAGLSFLLG